MIQKTSFVAAGISAAFLLCLPSAWSAAADYADVKAQIAKQHDEEVKRLQDWIKLPSIAAEDLNYPQGADYMIKLLKDAGIPARGTGRDQGQAGSLCHPRRGRGQDRRPLFHVRRETV